MSDQPVTDQSSEKLLYVAQMLVELAELSDGCGERAKVLTAMIGLAHEEASTLIGGHNFRRRTRSKKSESPADGASPGFLPIASNLEE